jgi:hypothetical protein
VLKTVSASAKWLCLCIAALITLAHSIVGLIQTIGSSGEFGQILLTLPFPLFLLVFKSLRLATLSLVVLLIGISVCVKQFDAYLSSAIGLVAAAWLISALGGNLPASDFDVETSAQ